MRFSVDEMNVIAIYDTSDRNKLITQLKAVLPNIEDTELSEITAEAINKLERMTDEEFSSTEFKSFLTPEEKEGYQHE